MTGQLSPWSVVFSLVQFSESLICSLGLDPHRIWRWAQQFVNNFTGLISQPSLSLLCPRYFAVPSGLLFQSFDQKNNALFVLFCHTCLMSVPVSRQSSEWTERVKKKKKVTGIRSIFLGPFDLIFSWQGRVPSLKVLGGPYCTSYGQEVPFPPWACAEGAFPGTHSVCVKPLQGLGYLESRPEYIRGKKW